MSKKDLRQLAVAVFFLFGTIGPLTKLMDARLLSQNWLQFLLITVASGSFSAAIILTSGKPFRLIVSVFLFSAFTISASIFEKDLFPSPATSIKIIANQPTVYSHDELGAIRLQRVIFGFVAIAMLSFGYALFIRVIGREVKRRTEVEAEIKFAEEIHDSLLPDAPYSTSWCGIAGLSIPAKKVGGDYYDIIPTGNTAVMVVIADASGHGAGAGVLAAMVKSGILQEMRHTQTLAEILHNVNETVFHTTKRNMFVTCAIIVIDHQQHTAEYITAGHPPIYCRQAGALSELRTPNVALGMKQDVVFASKTIQIRPGDGFLLYSDGVLDAENRSGEQFGSERLRTMFNRVDAGTPDEQVHTIMQSLRTFAGENEIQDDATAVMISIRS